MGNANTLPESEEEEWLQDLQDSQTLDFSRQVNHSQFIKVTINLDYSVHMLTFLLMPDDVSSFSIFKASFRNHVLRIYLGHCLSM